MRIVIIGNGVAGIEAALAVRAKDHQSSITIVSEESDYFFSRTALMYVLSGQLQRRELEPHPRDLYTRLSLRLSRARVVGIDLAQKSVRLADGKPQIPYDRLLIACGSRPRAAPWPGSALGGIGHFVTLRDLDWLEAEVGSRNAAERVERSDSARRRVHPAATGPRLIESPWVIGGGLIGIEVVETLLALGYRPRFALRDEWFWPISINAHEAGWIEARLREHGVELRSGASVERFEGEGRVSRIHLNGRAEPCDLAVVAIGVEPNTAWLEGSGIALEDGAIAVDEGLMTSAPDVFAAGDCAGILGAEGRRRPQQLWYTARDQGRVAGARLLGEPARYRPGMPYNSAKLMDIEFTTVGLVPPRGGGRSWTFEERGPVRSVLRLVVDGERVVGVNALGRRWDHSVFRRFIEEGLSVGQVIDRLPEAAFDTELVPPLVIPAADRARSAEVS